MSKEENLEMLELTVRTPNMWAKGKRVRVTQILPGPGGADFVQYVGKEGSIVEKHGRLDKYISVKFTDVPDVKQFLPAELERL